MSADRENRRICLDEIPGDLMTVSDICDWSGASKNTVYEWCRSGFLKDDVVHLGDRLIRVRKTALARLVDGVS